MSRSSSTNDLRVKIEELELLQLRQIDELKSSGMDLLQSISPVNILKNTLQNVVSSPGIRANFLNTAVGIGAGWLGKKLYVRQSKNVFKKIVGSGLQLLLTSIVSKIVNNARENSTPKE